MHRANSFLLFLLIGLFFEIKILFAMPSDDSITPQETHKQRVIRKIREAEPSLTSQYRIYIKPELLNVYSGFFSSVRSCCPLSQVQCVLDNLISCKEKISLALEDAEKEQFFLVKYFSNNENSISSTDFFSCLIYLDFKYKYYQEPDFIGIHNFMTKKKEDLKNIYADIEYFTQRIENTKTQKYKNMSYEKILTHYKNDSDFKSLTQKQEKFIKYQLTLLYP